MDQKKRLNRKDSDSDEATEAFEKSQSRFADPEGKTRARLEKTAETAASPAPTFLAEHVVIAGDNLSAIARKYYGSAGSNDWKVIYDANREVIGDNPNLLRVGQKLTIPKRS